MNLARLARWADWWDYKMPPHCGVAWAFLLTGGLASPEGLALAAPALLVTGTAIGAWGYLVNDLSDIAPDRAAGRANAMASLAPPLRFAALAVCLVAAFAPALVPGYPREALPWLAACAIVPGIYSLRPVRLKERGVLGVAADAAGAYVLPILFLGALLLRPGDGPATVLVAAAAWGGVAGVRGILRHQLKDRAADAAADCRTFVTARDPAAVVRFLRTIVMPAELAAFGAVAWTMQDAAPALPWVYGGWLVHEFVKVALGFRQRFHAGDAEERHLPLSNNLFYESLFPMTLAAHLAAGGGAFLALPIAQVALFPRVWTALAADLWAGGTAIVARSQRSPLVAAVFGPVWNLDTQLGAEATLSTEGVERAGGVRLVVSRGGPEPWSVRAFRRRIGVFRGTRYHARVRVRADRPANVVFGLCEATQPWRGLGLHSEIAAGAEWRTLDLRFVASRSATSAQLYLWAGGAPATIEIDEMTIERDRARAAAAPAEPRP